MARRSALELIAEAYELADAHLARIEQAGMPAASPPRDMLALGLFLPLVETRDEIARRLRRQDRRIRKVRRLARRALAASAERRPAAVPDSGPALHEREFAVFADDEWVRLRLALQQMPGTAGGSS